MESKGFLFAVIPLLGIIFVFGYLNIVQESPVSIEESQICQTVEYNGPDRIDILFISSVEDAQHYTDVLLNSEPYKSKKDYFNSYVISEKQVECQDYKGIAILCNTPSVQDLAKNCPHDYIVVVKEEPIKIRSSSYGNVLSINKVHEDSVLIHEMGHAFGNLAEEYGGAKLQPGAKNCVSSCDKFNAPVDSCSLECSQSNFYRSINAGVMRTLITSNYGIYDNGLLDKLLEKNKPSDSSITGLQIEYTEQCTDQVFAVEISQDNLKVDSDNILKSGCVPDKSGAGELCIEDKCYPNIMFTDSQDISVDETINGETFTPEEPLTFYVQKTPDDSPINITLEGTLIGTINSKEIGATACTI